MNELALGSSSGAMYGSVAERLWRTSVRCGLGVAGLAALTAVLDRLHFRSALLYLIIVVFVSLTGDFVASAVVSLGALLCLSYFLSPPGFLLGLDQPLNLVALLGFLTAARDEPGVEAARVVPGDRGPARPAQARDRYDSRVDRGHLAQRLGRGRQPRVAGLHGNSPGGRAGVGLDARASSR